MSMSALEIIREIKKYATHGLGKYPNNFYIGITNNPEKKFNQELGVLLPRGSREFICQAINETHARAVEAYFIYEGMQMQGEYAGRYGRKAYVYCYCLAEEANH